VQLIDNGLKHSSDEVIEAASFQPICRPSQSCAWQLTRSYLRPLSVIIITFYINSCCHNPKRFNTTIFDNADKFSLPARTSHLADNNFIQRMLYHDVYWLCTFASVHLLYIYMMLRFVGTLINTHDDVHFKLQNDCMVVMTSSLLFLLDVWLC